MLIVKLIVGIKRERYIDSIFLTKIGGFINTIL